MRDGSKGTLVRILRTLQDAGFSLSEVDSEDCCLEVVAKKGGTKLLIKTLDNADNEPKETAEDLCSLASAFSASPIIVGQRVQSGPIEEGALYERYGVNVISAETFRDVAVSGKLPIVYSKRGGLYFKVDGSALRRLREEKGMSRGELAKKVGVSAKSVYEYEKGKMGAILDTVARLEEILNAGVTEGIDVFEWRCSTEPFDRNPSGPVARQLHTKLHQIGCKAIGFNHAPIDVHAGNVGVSFLANDRESGEMALDKRVETATELGKLMEVEPVLVTGDTHPRDLDIVVIRIDEVKQLRTLRDLEHLLDSDKLSC
jgi:putative transcriptional regulator